MMRKYRYWGMSGTGREVEGTIEAGSQQQAASQLREEGIFVTRIEEIPCETAESQASPAGAENTQRASLPEDVLERLPDYRNEFQPKLEHTTKRRQKIGCLGFLVVFVTVVLLALLWPDHLAWYWALPVLVLEVLVFWWLAPAWPNCPACGRGFARLGFYCSDCGNELPNDATPKQAYCPHCRYVVEIVSKRPKAKRYRGLPSVGSMTPLRDGISRSPHPKEGPLVLSEYRYVPVPLRYCPHCRARLGD